MSRNLSEDLGKLIRPWQWMTAARRGDGKGQILFYVGVERAGDMRAQVLLFSPRRMAKIETAVQDGPVRVIDV